MPLSLRHNVPTPKRWQFNYTNIACQALFHLHYIDTDWFYLGVFNLHEINWFSSINLHKRYCFRIQTTNKKNLEIINRIKCFWKICLIQIHDARVTQHKYYVHLHYELNIDQCITRPIKFNSRFRIQEVLRVEVVSRSFAGVQACQIFWYRDPTMRLI